MTVIELEFLFHDVVYQITSRHTVIELDI